MRLYKLDAGSYPSMEEGLDVLVEKPEGNSVRARNWSGPYLNELPRDPWGRRLQCMFPRFPSVDPEGTEPGIWSLGSDGKDQTADDIANWAFAGERASSTELQIEKLFNSWKTLPAGSKESERIAQEVRLLHRKMFERLKPNTESWRQAGKKLVRLSRPFLMESIPQPMAASICELTKPNAAIRFSDRMAKTGRPTEPLGWDVQAT